MGILTNRRDPVVREPVVLIEDRSYADDYDKNNNGASNGVSEPPLFVTAVPDPNIEPPPPGTEVFVICPMDDEPTIWTSDPTRGRVGCVEGLEALEIAHLCQSNQQGLTGKIENCEDGGNPNDLRIRINAS